MARHSKKDSSQPYTLIWSPIWGQFIRVSSKYGEFIPDWDYYPRRRRTINKEKTAC